MEDLGNKSPLQYLHGCCGFLSLITFAVGLGVWGTNTAVGFNVVSTSDFRTLNETTGDDINWQLPELVDVSSTAALIVLLSVAAGVSFLYHCGLFASSGVDLMNNVSDSYNRHTWLRRGLVEPLIWVAISYAAGVSNVFLITYIALTWAVVQVLQSAHEAVARKSYFAGAESPSGSDASWFNMLPKFVHFYLFATLLALLTFIAWIVYYAEGEVAVGTSQSVYVPLTIFLQIGLYLVFHLFAVTYYTTYAGGEVYASKEPVYLVFEALTLHLPIWFLLAGLSTA